MPSRNLTFANPAPPSGKQNIKFQLDATASPQEVSAYMPIEAGDGIALDDSGDVLTISADNPVQNFTDLGDVPASYSGKGSKVVAVKVDESGLEFIAASSGGAAGFSSLIGLRRTTLVVADAANTIGGAPSYAIGDVWTKVKSDNLIGQSAMSANGPFTSYAGNNFNDQAGIRGKYIYRTGKNVHALGMGWLLRTTAINFWFVLANSVGAEYGTQGFAPNGSPLTTVDFAAFRFSTTQGDSNWQCLTCDGSTITTANSGVAADTSPHKFLIIFDDTTPAVKFYIDGTLVATITTHLPRASKNLAIQFSAAEPSSFAGEAINIIQIAAQSDF